MLTADLIQVRIGKKKIEPRFIATDNEESVGLAGSLLEIFQENVGKKKRDLDADLADFLGTGTEFLLHRGLAKLLSDRCEFETRAVIEPVDLRRKVFLAAAAAYREGLSKDIDREAVYQNVGDDIEAEIVSDGLEIDGELDFENLENGLYADLKDEQVLAKFEGGDAAWLLDRYNVALAQGVLFRATEMFIEVRGESAQSYRELFRRMKFFRLLFEVEGTAEVGYRIRLDGPASVLKSAHRYGLQMASFLPGLLHCESWELRAEVLWGPRKARRVLELDSTMGLRPYSHRRGQWIPDEVAWFEEQFDKIKSGWTVSSETELVDLGGQGILIPDYVFEHAESGTRAHKEVLGFWRRGAARSRLELLKERGPENLILAVSKELHVGDEDLDDIPGQVYVFRSSPVAREVRKLLDALLA